MSLKNLKGSAGSKKSSSATASSKSGSKPGLRVKPRSPATRTKPGNGATSPKVKIKAKVKSSSRQPGALVAATSKGSTRKPGNVKASPRKGDSLGSYRLVDGVEARVPSRRQSQLTYFKTVTLDDGWVSVTCPGSECGREFKVERDWLKGRLFFPNPASLKPNMPKVWLYESASCPYCFRTSYRFPEGEGLSDDDFE